MAPLKRAPEALLGNRKCTVAVSSSTVLVTVRDGGCAYNIEKKTLITMGFGFNSKTMSPFAFLFREEHVRFGQEW